MCKKKNSCTLNSLICRKNYFCNNPIIFFRSSVGWGCRIHWLHLCSVVRLPQRVSCYMTLNNPMVRLELWVMRSTSRYNGSQVHSQVAPYLWVKQNCLTFKLSTYAKPDIGLAVRVFANGPGDLDSFPGWVIPKTQKMVLDASLLNTQHYKVRIKGKVKQSRERSSALPHTLV